MSNGTEDVTYGVLPWAEKWFNWLVYDTATTSNSEAVTTTEPVVTNNGVVEPTSVAEPVMAVSPATYDFQLDNKCSIDDVVDPSSALVVYEPIRALDVVEPTCPFEVVEPTSALVVAEPTGALDEVCTAEETATSLLETVQECVRVNPEAAIYGGIAAIGLTVAAAVGSWLWLRKPTVDVSVEEIEEAIEYRAKQDEARKDDSLEINFGHYCDQKQNEREQRRILDREATLREAAQKALQDKHDTLPPVPIRSRSARNTSKPRTLGTVVAKEKPVASPILPVPDRTPALSGVPAPKASVDHKDGYGDKVAVMTVLHLLRNRPHGDYAGPKNWEKNTDRLEGGLSLSQKECLIGLGLTAKGYFPSENYPVRRRQAVLNLEKIGYMPDKSYLPRNQ